MIFYNFKNYIKSNNNISNPIKKIIYNYTYHSYSVIIQIRDISTIKKKIKENIFKKNNCTLTLPKVFNKKEIIKKSELPEVNLYKFEKAVVNADSSSIFYDKKLITFRTKDERFNEGFVEYHNNKHAKVRLGKLEFIDNGFFLGGNGSWNWYHFTIEILPKLLYYDAEKYSKIILVSNVIKQIPSMYELLRSIIPENCKIKFLDRNKSYKVDNLYHINEINHIQFNRFDNKILSEGSFFNDKALRQFSEKIISHFKIDYCNKINSPDKIFLYRKSKHRVARNQEVVKQKFIDNGFKTICLEELSLKEQISHFVNAKFIAGISGAAWTNIIYCRKKPKAICFIPDNALEFCSFSGLATIFNVDLYHLSYFNNNSHHYNNDFEINISELDSLLQKLNNA